MRDPKTNETYVLVGAALSTGTAGPIELTTISDRLRACQVLLSDRETLREYLGSHPDPTAHLPAFCETARSEFGPEAELSLELYRDPKIGDPYLTFTICLSSYEKDTIARVDCVSRKFEQELEQASGYLLLTTDFRAPRDPDAVCLESVPRLARDF